MIIKKEAKDLISIQIESFKALSNHILKIESQISKLLELIRNLELRKGSRVIITGMGKSGHIARKFAASLSSTGTAAIYLHPSEASHGDLGMIKHGDIVIALSVSGETTELGDIIVFCKTNSVPLIGISFSVKSSLGLASHVNLDLPPVEEICPLGLAPTTSSLIMMAFCDILTVLILQSSNFLEKDFQKLHPAGNLGKIVTQVSDIMTSGDNLPLIGIDSLIHEIIVEIDKKKFGCVGVQDGSKLVGIITDGDIRRFLLNNISNFSQTTKAKSLMTKNPLTIKKTDNLLFAKNVMSDKKITQLFVVDKDHKPIGIVHLHDC